MKPAVQLCLKYSAKLDILFYKSFARTPMTDWFVRMLPDKSDCAVCSGKSRGEGENGGGLMRASGAFVPYFLVFA